jgi:DNA polymerase
MKPHGRGEKGILIVMDYPGKAEDAEGRPAVGATGQYLEDELARLGVEMWRDCVVTNALTCYDPSGGKNTPESAAQDCRPNLLQTVKDTDPRLIFLMGGEAVKSLIGHVWKESVGPVSRWTGHRIPCRDPNAWVCPTNNPAFILRELDRKQAVPQVHFREHLKRALELEGRPWPDGPPDYESMVECVFDPDEAAYHIRKFRGLVAFDYETTCLKADSQFAEIVCCSISDGQKTVAFPWHPTVFDPMRRLLSDPEVGKISSNLKMEHSWSLRHLGVEVVNWRWDTMLGAHVYDARSGGAAKDDQTHGSGTTGLKFRSFVHLGAPDYNSHVEDFLKGVRPGGNAPNRIKEVRPSTILTYCGVDALLEWHLARVQMKEAGLWPE